MPPRKEALDAKGVLLKAGDRVRSTTQYGLEGIIVEGVVEALRKGRAEKGLIKVRHTSGSRAGQLWTSAAFLWEKT